MSKLKVVDRRALPVKDLLGPDHHRIEETISKWIREQREQGREVIFRVDDLANIFIYEALDVVMDLQPTGVLLSGEAGPDDDARREAADDHRQVQDARKGRARQDVALVVLCIWILALTIIVLSTHPAT